MKIRVYYEDTDAGGVVYHANYLKFCERARSENIFLKHSSPQRGEKHFVITKMEASFKASAKLGDLIDVSYEVHSMGRASINIFQEIHSSEGKLLFSMLGTYALTDENGKPCKLSQEDKDLFS